MTSVLDYNPGVLYQGYREGHWLSNHKLIFIPLYKVPIQWSHHT